MFRISNDTPGQFFTSVAKDRLPVFRTDAIKQITCQALAESRKSGGFLIYGESQLHPSKSGQNETG